MNWTVPDSATILRVNASEYDRLRVQVGSGANVGKFRAVMSRVPASALSSVPFSGWFDAREGAEEYLVNLAAQLGPAWIQTEQREFVNAQRFHTLEVRQGSGENAGQWKAYHTRIVAGVEEIEDLSVWKAGRAGAMAVAQQVAVAIDSAQATISSRLSGVIGGRA